MTEGAAWRFRWLLEACATIRRLRASLATGVPDDARLLRSMLNEIRCARRQVCALATLRGDEQTLASLPEVGPEVAPAVALRLRGASLRTAAASVPQASVTAALERLAALVGPAVETRQVPVPPAPHDREPIHATDTPATPAEAWIGRTLDPAGTLRHLRRAMMAGHLPAATSAVTVCARGARGSGYLQIGFPGPAAALWGWLRRCGLRLLGPVAAGT